MPTLKTCANTYDNPDGSIPTGQVTFVPTGWLQHATANLTVPAQTVVATLDENGAISVELFAIDDSDVITEGLAYTMIEEIDGAVRSRVIQVLTLASEPIKLSALADATTTEYVTYATQVALDALTSDLDSLSAVVAGMESQLSAHLTKHIATLFNAVSISSSHSATNLPHVMVAPFACTLNYAALITSLAGIASDPSNRWDVELRRYRAGVSAVIASKSTNGNAISQYVPWEFTPLDPSNKVLQAGDVVALFFTKTGSPNNWTVMQCTVGYTPA